MYNHQVKVKMLSYLEQTELKKTKIDLLIVNYILPVGLLIQLTSIAWGGRSIYLSLTNFFLLLPGLILILINIPAIKKWKPQMTEWLLILFFITAIVSMNWTDGKSTIVDLIKRILSITIYIYSIYRVSKRQGTLLKILNTSAFIMSISALLSIFIQYYINENPIGYKQFRIYSTGISDLGDISNPILAGLFYTPFALILFLNFCREKENKQWKEACMLGFISIFSYVVFTWSRGPWIALAASLIVASLCLRNRTTKKILVLGSILLTVFLLSNIDEIYRSFITTGFGNRVEIWNYTISKILNNPYYGYGWDSLFSFKTPTYNNINHPHPHSLYLKIFYDLGLVGGLLFMALIFKLFHTAYNYRNEKLVQIATPIIASGCIGMMTDVSVIITRTNETWIFFWLPLALIISTSIRFNKKTTSDVRLSHPNI